VGIRSFLALELPPQIKQELLRIHEVLKRSSLEVRWVRPEGIHLTVVFMGDVQEASIPPIIKMIGEVCSYYGPFPVALRSMGCFPNSRNPRVLWVGVESDRGRMSRFRDGLQEILLPFGIRTEKRDFRPHLTLGRFKRPGKVKSELEALLLKHGGLTSPFSSLNELILFRSDLKPGGAVYTKMKLWQLTGDQ
jgi:RNA 2',3'-cyclic 3'-phosphodiesterase